MKIKGEKIKYNFQGGPLFVRGPNCVQPEITNKKKKNDGDINMIIIILKKE